MAKSETIDTSCPMQTGLNLLSGKWRLKIIWEIMKSPVHFNELQRRLHPITAKTLSRELHELENLEIIRRTVYPENPPKVEYSITTKGTSIRPILAELCNWGKKYQPEEHNTRKDS